MGPVEVIVGNPTFGFLSDLVETGEGPSIEHVVAIAAVEALDEAVPGRLVRSDVLEADAGIGGPSLESVAGELGSIVQAEAPGTFTCVIVRNLI